MPGITLDKLKQFESLIKKCLVAKYGKYLPQDKVTLLNSTSFVNEDILKNVNSVETAQGNTIRAVLGGIIDVRCTKEIKIDEKLESIDYGSYLQDGLIEYYTQELANKYHLRVDDKPELKDNLDMIVALKNRLDEENFNEMAFTKNAVEILDAAGIEDLIKENDTKAIEEHLAINNGIDLTAMDNNESKGIDDKVSKDSRIQIVYINGTQYIKYVDLDDNVHLVESTSPEKISKIYKEALASLDDNKNLTPEILFDRMTTEMKEVPSIKTDEVDPELLNSEEVNMLDFIRSNDKVLEKAEDEKFTHFKDMDIHAIEETNELVSTESHPDHVESNIIEDSVEPQNIASGVSQSPQQEERNDEQELSEGEYAKIYNKFANNEELTLDELRALRRSNPQEQTQLLDENIDELVEEKGPKLTLNSKSYPMAGFTNKYLMVFVVIITSCIGIIVGALLFKIFN